MFSESLNLYYIKKKMAIGYMILSLKKSDRAVFLSVTFISFSLSFFLFKNKLVWLMEL